MRSFSSWKNFSGMWNTSSSLRFASWNVSFWFMHSVTDDSQSMKDQEIFSKSACFIKDKLTAFVAVISVVVLVAVGCRFCGEVWWAKTIFALLRKSFLKARVFVLKANYHIGLVEAQQTFLRFLPRFSSEFMKYGNSLETEGSLARAHRVM